MSAAGDPNRYHHSHVVEQGVSASENANVHIGRLTINNQGHQTERQCLLRDKLRFRELRSRESAIDCEHEGTCTWLLETSQYASWRANPPAAWHHRLLWIKGNAGAGKSTMMKFAVKNARRTGELILPHFFNARGTELEHSTEGMYRTLLYWLLDQLPREAREKLDTLYEHHESQAWQVPELADILDVALVELGDRPITFYIDALDECPNAEVRDMLKVFRRIVRAAYSSGRHVRVCFASRPYPHITFTDAIFLDFSEQEHHLGDIQRYIDDELRIGASVSAHDIRRDLCTKAAGSFIWAVLVIKILNKEHDSGHMETLKARLGEIPPGLHDLYSYTLRRYPENLKALLICCQWLLYAAQGLNVLEMWWSMQWKLSRHKDASWRLYECPEPEAMERYILDATKGFVEFRKPKDRAFCRYPQFLHESVREFVLHSPELWHLCGVESPKAFSAHGHEELRDCCVAVSESQRSNLQTLIEIHGDNDIPNNAILDIWDTRYTSGHPLALYAAKYTIFHAEEVQRLGSDQTAFLDDYTRRCGPHFLSPSDIRLTASTTCVAVLHSPLSLLFDASTSFFIYETQKEIARTAWEQGKPFGLVENGRRSPLQQAIANRRLDSIDGLLKVYLHVQPRQTELQVLLCYLFGSWKTIKLYFGSSCSAPLLQVATVYPDLASFLLLACARDDTLVPHLDSLTKGFYIPFGFLQYPGSTVRATSSTAFLEFLRAFYFFLDKNLSSTAITCGNQEITDWAGNIVAQQRSLNELQHKDIIHVLGTIQALVGAR